MDDGREAGCTVASAAASQAGEPTGKSPYRVSSTEPKGPTLGFAGAMGQAALQGAPAGPAESGCMTVGSGATLSGTTPACTGFPSGLGHSIREGWPNNIQAGGLRVSHWMSRWLSDTANGGSRTIKP